MFQGAWQFTKDDPQRYWSAAKKLRAARSFVVGTGSKTHFSPGQIEALERAATNANGRVDPSVYAWLARALHGGAQPYHASDTDKARNNVREYKRAGRLRYKPWTDVRVPLMHRLARGRLRADENMRRRYLARSVGGTRRGLFGSRVNADALRHLDDPAVAQRVADDLRARRLSGQAGGEGPLRYVPALGLVSRGDMDWVQRELAARRALGHTVGADQASARAASLSRASSVRSNNNDVFYDAREEPSPAPATPRAAPGPNWNLDGHGAY